MDADEETKFKELRHRFYRLAHHGPALLIEMGVLQNTVGGIRFSKDEIRDVLFDLASRGKLQELETLITKKEAEILGQIGHVGDPCQFCGASQDQVKPDPCLVRKKMVQP
jgi:hypothetical protein